MSAAPVFPRVRPLHWLSRIVSAIAFVGLHQPTYLPVGSFRARLHCVGIALGWMARGNQYDRRTFGQRMCAGAFFWRQAVRP